MTGINPDAVRVHDGFTLDVWCVTEVAANGVEVIGYNDAKANGKEDAVRTFVEWEHTTGWVPVDFHEQHAPHFEVGLGSGRREVPLGPLFGVLVRLTQGHLKHYVGDLFYDADWLRRKVDGPCVFYFSVRSTGTDIAHHLDDIVHEGRVYRCDLTLSGSESWRVTVDQVAS